MPLEALLFKNISVFNCSVKVKATSRSYWRNSFSSGVALGSVVQSQ
jgi:hypothetical protein